MALEKIGEAGFAHRPRPQNLVPARNLPNDSTVYRSRQAQPARSRMEQLNERAAAYAHEAALKDAKRALHACLPEDRAELRQSSAALFGWAKSLRAEVTA